MNRNYVFRIQTDTTKSERLTVTMIGKGHYKWTHNEHEHSAMREANGVWSMSVDGTHLEEEFLSLKDCIARCFGITRKLIQSVIV